ncbi:unnamed protein product [Onchocerca flexuosa]|uniref:Ovule protein n=1 Tax=Onchocerca flexuosa TaxID=387005 RepID=A0A183HV75_9BILA|nr:unnamed protein product [Onchocerca flexuosa]
MVTRLSKDKRMKNDEERWRNENDNFESQKSMKETEFVDDGWMISKRRRVITNDATVITNKPLHLSFFLIFPVLPLLRL